jgi:hypothetical protein
MSVFCDKTVGLRESLVCVAFGQEHRGLPRTALKVSTKHYYGASIQYTKHINMNMRLYVFLKYDYIKIGFMRLLRRKQKFNVPKN